MKLVDITCNKCGAVMQINEDLDRCMCAFCGNEMLIDREINKQEIVNGFEFGYESEKGRIKAQNEYLSQLQAQEREKALNAVYVVNAKEKTTYCRGKLNYKDGQFTKQQIIKRRDKMNITRTALLIIGIGIIWLKFPVTTSIALVMLSFSTHVFASQYSRDLLVVDAIEKALSDCEQKNDYSMMSKFERQI